MKPIKILFVIKLRSYDGVTIGLANSVNLLCNGLNLLKHVETKIVKVNSDNEIDKEIHDFQPDICILEAIFVRPIKIFELSNLYPSITFNVRSHSKFPFLSNEGNAINWLSQIIDYAYIRDNIHLSANNKDFVCDVSQVLGFPFDYLPNIYEPTDIPEKQIKDHKHGIIDISLFCAIRPLKNMLEQAASAILFAKKINKKVHLHINSNRVEQNADPVLKNLRALFSRDDGHILIEHLWQPHADFMKLISSMDIGLQVSLSETFNIIVADHVINKVPIVVSTDIDWMPEYLRAEPTSTDDIVKKLDYAWRNKNMATKKSLKHLTCYNAQAFRAWGEYLGKFK